MSEEIQGTPVKFPTRPCKGCKKELVWATDPDGKAIPLDPSAPIYSTRMYDGKVTCVRLLPGANIHGDPMGAFVSHFKTCPNAGDFSRAKKKEGTA